MEYATGCGQGHIIFETKDMEINTSYSSTSAVATMSRYLKKADSSSGSDASPSVDFSNMTTHDIEETTLHLYQDGKISWREFAEMPLLDGRVVNILNNRSDEDNTDSVNVYDAIDNAVAMQKKYGTIKVQENIQMLESLRKTLEENDPAYQQSKVSITAWISC